MKPTDDIRADFPILQRTIGHGSGMPLIYLDSAATAQKPEPVLRTVDELHRTLNANIHRAGHFLGEAVTARYEAARETVREFIGAGSTQEVIFTSGATDAINLVAFSFGERFVGPGDNLIISELEHHSNIVPWQLMAARRGAEIRVLPFDEFGQLLFEKLPALIDERTRIVAVTQASNVLGTRPDLPSIIRIAHAAGVPVLVDGCQGIVHGGVDVGALDCDFYAFSGHKLYGPTGIGVLYGKERWLAQLPPYRGGGEMIEPGSVRLPDGVRFAELPYKFEAGTPNFVGAIGLGTAIDYVRSVGDTTLYESELCSYVSSRLTNEIAGIRLYGTAWDKAPIVSFCVEGTSAGDIGTLVDKLAGVAIRTGRMCAEPVMAHYGVEFMCRLSIGLYTTQGELDVAVEAIKKAVTMLR